MPDQEALDRAHNYARLRAARDPAYKKLILDFARTLYGEYGHFKDIKEPWAVACVIKNRADSGQFGGDTVSDVCLAYNTKKDVYQFSCWHPAQNCLPAMMAHDFTSQDPRFRTMIALAALAVDGKLPDITNGADHYHGDYIDAPKWADQDRITAKVGAHIFYKLHGEIVRPFQSWTMAERSKHIEQNLLPKIMACLPSHSLGKHIQALTVQFSETSKDGMERILSELPFGKKSHSLQPTSHDPFTLVKPAGRKIDASYTANSSGSTSRDGTTIEIPNNLSHAWTVTCLITRFAESDYRQFPIKEQFKFGSEVDYVNQTLNNYAAQDRKYTAFLAKIKERETAPQTTKEWIAKARSPKSSRIAAAEEPTSRRVAFTAPKRASSMPYPTPTLPASAGIAAGLVKKASAQTSFITP